MRLVKITATAALVVALVAAPAVTATAAERVADRTVSTAFTPSPNKFREFMLNIVSSVLGGATPKAWRAEQIANQYKYNHSTWEQLNADLGIDGVRVNSSGQTVGFKYTNRGQGTYTDVVIDGLETQFTNSGKKGGAGNKPMTAPATKPVKLLKLAGGVLTAYTAFELANMLGASGVNGVGSLFGFDAQGVVCGNTGSDVVGQVTQFLSGQDCSMFDLDPLYVKNGDAGEVYGPITAGGRTITYMGSKDEASYSYVEICYKFSGTLQSGYSIQGQPRSGGWTYISPGSATGSTCSAYSGSTNWTPGWKTGAASQTFLASPQLRIVNSTGTPVATMSKSMADPNRQQECVVTYTDNSILSALGPVYQESGGQIQPAPCPATPKGKTPSKVTTNDKQLGGGPTTKVAEESVTPEYKDWWEKYPECVTGACKLDLLKKTSPTSVPASCFDLEYACTAWNEDPNKADVYTCRYGSHSVDLKECNAYSGLFTPGRIDAGAAYSDPKTGTWSGGQTSPKSGATAMSVNLQDPEKPRTCDLAGLGFDPIGWVMRPVQCAMEWTFVPRPTVVQVAYGGAGDAWSGKPPARIASAVQTLNLHPSVSGCSISVNLFGHDVKPIDACPGSWAENMPVVSRLFVSAAFAVLIWNVVRRQISGMVGYNQGQ